MIAFSEKALSLIGQKMRNTGGQEDVVCLIALAYVLFARDEQERHGSRELPPSQHNNSDSRALAAST